MYLYYYSVSIFLLKGIQNTCGIVPTYIPTYIHIRLRVTILRQAPVRYKPKEMKKKKKNPPHLAYTQHLGNIHRTHHTSMDPREFEDQSEEVPSLLNSGPPFTCLRFVRRNERALYIATPFCHNHNSKISESQVPSSNSQVPKLVVRFLRCSLSHHRPLPFVSLRRRCLLLLSLS